MSKLEDLIQELCPNGVEYKTLGEISTDIYRGSGIKRDQITETGIPCVRYGEIYTKYGIWFDQCFSKTQLNQVKSPKFFEHGDLLFAITGESIEDIAKTTTYVGKGKCLAGGDIVVLKHNQNPKYLSYALSTSNAQEQKSKGKVKSKVVHSSVPAIQNIKIPVPPLEVQEEIVRILDTFTKLIHELTNELTARKHQYEYYRDRLLTFDDSGKWKALGEIAHIFRGEYITKNSTHRGNIPVILGGQEPAYYIDKFNHTGEVIVISRSGISAGFVSYWNEPIFITDGFGYEAKTEIVVPKYLYFVLKNMEIHLNKMKRGAGIPHISGEALKKIQIPIPSLEEQERIVAILDRFDSLCNDLTSGLPAEIEARQKQYEYYRDKLLSFKELKDE